MADETTPTGAPEREPGQDAGDAPSGRLAHAPGDETHAGPESESFHMVAARWAAQQCEPLVPSAVRLSTEGELLALTVTNPDRTVWWFAGVLCDQVLTLPPDDPWRNLPARAGATIRGTNPPAAVGATRADGAPFGTLADGNDLVNPKFSSPMTDVGLIALAQPLSPWGAAAVAFAADGWEACGRALAEMHATFALSTDGPAAEPAAALVAVGVEATRWAVWRRRAYTGPADDWFIASAFTWLWRAENLASGGHLPDDELVEIEESLLLERIDPDTYRVITEAGRS